MPPFPRGTLGARLLIACLALAGSHAAAETLPPLRIDPLLLGGSGRSGARPQTASTGQVSPPSAAASATTATPSKATTSISAPVDAPTPAPAAPVANPTTATHAPPEAALATPRAPTVATLPIGKDSDQPTFIAADSLQGINDREVLAVGSVEMTRGEMRMQTDRLSYRQQDEELEATGNIRFTQRGDKLSGPYLKIQTEAKTGVFEQPVYEISQSKVGNAGKNDDRIPKSRQTTGYGKADRLYFEGDGQYRFKDVTYSTCKPSDGGEQDWFVRIADLKLDYNDEVGEGSDTSVVFKGVPILYFPSLSFSLNNKRKSGLLAPTLGSTSKSGFEYAQPVYWNIAPDMDATITPRLMSKRGLQLNGELRYLGAAYNGQTRVEYLPSDRLLGTRRSGYSMTHNQYLGGGFFGQLNLNGVSDDTYFSDLSTKVSTVSQSNLLRQGSLLYQGGWWQANLLAQSYQTLQDPSLPPIGIPYQRMPQLTVNALRADLPAGMQFNLLGEHVSFRHPTLTEGSRLTVYPQISLPWQTAAFYVTPKIGVHATRYSLDRIVTAGMPEQQSRTLPILSVDAGAFFERDVVWFGRKLNQTLEPRLYYLNIPSRDQQSLPVFDTAIADFNFAQIFAENRYVGGDRIADANQLTAVVTSRLIDPDTGAELIRGAFGQRLYFTTQHVGLPGETLRTSRQTDLLAALTGQILPRTNADFALQYNPRDRRTERFNLGVRYQPETGKVINAGYRYTRDILGALQPGVGQVDVSGQWPLGGAWHAVGRYNYSTKDHRVVETLGGLEYDGGCWVARVVVQRLATQAQNSNTAMFLQLELNDFSRIGSNPLELLKRNIPGYGNINQPNADPAFISN